MSKKTEFDPRQTTSVYLVKPNQPKHIDVDVNGRRQAYFPEEPGVTLETILSDVTERVKAAYQKAMAKS